MLYLLIALLIVVAVLAVLVVRERRQRDRDVIDLRSLDQWEQTRRALAAARDSGHVTVGQALGVVLLSVLFLAAMLLVGAVETAGLA